MDFWTRGFGEGDPGRRRMGSRPQAAWRPAASREGTSTVSAIAPKRATEEGLSDCPGNALSKGLEVDGRRRAESLRLAGGRKRLRLLDCFGTEEGLGSRFRVRGPRSGVVDGQEVGSECLEADGEAWARVSWDGNPEETFLDGSVGSDATRRHWLPSGGEVPSRRAINVP